MMTQTDAAILGMLTVEPMSGYDMKQFCEQSLAHFWHASYGNLYPRLKRLEADGLIHGRLEARERAPDAIVYALTDEGRRRFVAWLETEPQPERVRNELVLKVFFGADAQRRTTVEHLRAEARRQEALREAYEAIARMLEGNLRGRPEGPFWQMALRRGQLLTEARLRWCDECLILLRRIEEEEEDR